MWQPNRQIARSTQRQPNRFPVTQLLKWSTLGFVCAAVGYGMYWLFGQWLVVKQISCYANQQQLTNDECNAASALMGKSMLFTYFDDPSNSMEMQKVTTSNHLLYYTHLRKQLPSQIKLYYTVSQPEYLVSTDQATWAAVNEQGALKVIDDPGQLPKVFCSGAWGSYLQNGQVIDMQTHHWIRSFLAEARQLGRIITYIGLDDRQQVSIIFEDGRRILVTGMADPTVELARLRLIEQESAQDERFSTVKIKEIDLRFKFPVIRTLST